MRVPNSSCRRARVGILAGFMLFPVAGFCWEIQTHDKMFEKAVPSANNSVHALRNLDIQANERLEYDRKKKKAIEWVQEGAQREDDTISELLVRYRNHFYDPVTEKAEKGFGGILWRDSGWISGEAAPDWALDEDGTMDKQVWSWRSARQYYFDGLTKSTEQERKSELGRMFRAIGQLTHLVEDMAQPQHTRNDGHGDGSLFEEFSKTPDVLGSMPGPNQIPSFTTAREYFTEMAEFSRAWKRGHHQRQTPRRVSVQRISSRTAAATGEASLSTS